MSTCQETILTLARIISGAGQEEEALLEPLCRTAEAQWRGRLRQGVAAEDCGETFACAAAFTAAAGLAAARCSGGVSGFTAGSVSVQLRAEAERDAEGLRQTAERLMAPYAKAADFCFRRVLG